MKLWSTMMEHRRLTAVVVCLIVLFGASLTLAFYAEREHVAQSRQSARVQAQVLAESVSGALAFGDTDTINQYTAALRNNPEIEAVAVYDDQTRLVSSFGPVPGESTAQPAPGTMAIWTPSVQDGVKMGTVYFRTRSEAMGTRIARYGGPALLVLMASLMLTVMAFDARALDRGNQRLRQEMAERERAEAALRQSQKMEAVGRLTGGIAHDFNNMLAVIIGNLDILTRRYPQADPLLLRFVTGSQEAAKRAAGLTQRLLAFSRRQPLDPRPADVGKAVTDMSDLLRRTLGETISIETVRAAGLWKAHIDLGQLETAIVNLAVNARDAMPGGGKLTIETANAYLDRDYANTQDEVTPGQYVLVAVSDTGTGIAREILDQVFEPFFTTKPSGLGTGLGLSQVHGFVKQSGGHISIYSEVGVGTTIKLYLPKSSAEAEAPEPEPARRAERDRRDVTVLVVDDEAGVRDFAAEALNELGYDVMTAENAEQALQIAGGSHRVDVLLTDVVMPDTNGRVLADAMHRKRPGIRVLFMTGYTQNAVIHNGVLDQGTNLITKPFTVDQLGQELDAVMGR
jgi:signal transduction histidine kinase